VEDHQLKKLWVLALLEAVDQLSLPDFLSAHHHDFQPVPRLRRRLNLVQVRDDLIWLARGRRGNKPPEEVYSDEGKVWRAGKSGKRAESAGNSEKAGKSGKERENDLCDTLLNFLRQRGDRFARALQLA